MVMNNQKIHSLLQITNFMPVNFVVGYLIFNSTYIFTMNVCYGKVKVIYQMSKYIFEKIKKRG